MSFRQKGSPRMRWSLRKLVSALFVPVALSADAEMRTVVGYGTGDTIGQALVMAKGDAVLNAGGKVASLEQVQGDVLVSDRGVSSNVLFVSEYRLLEKGESFDGVSARIEAKVCDVSERPFENGRRVTGEGEGPTEETARFAAIGDAMSELGVRIRAVGEYDRDVLVRDETESLAWAFAREIREVDSSCLDGVHKTKVELTAFADRVASGVAKRFSAESAGKGRTFAEAVNNARSKAAMDSDCAYAVKTIYDSGEFVSRSVRRDWRGFCYGTDVLGMSHGGNTWDVSARFDFDENEDSRLADGVFSVRGFGFAGDREGAIEDAKRDAVLGAGSAAEISVVCEEGKPTVERSRFRASAYVGMQTADVQSSGDGLSARIGAQVSRDRSRDSECHLAKSAASEKGEAYRSYLVARFKSIVNAGALYDVERSYEGDAVLTDACRVASARAGCGFDVEASFPDKVGEACSASSRMRVLSKGEVVGKTAFGVGLGETEAVAFELARCDAVVNASSSVDVRGRYDGRVLKESEQSFVGSAFVGGVSADGMVDLPEGLLVRVKSKVCGGPEDAKRVRPSRLECEAKASSVDAAVALARRGLLMKSGAMANVRTAYRGLELVQADAEYRASGVLTDCRMQIASDSHNACSVRASGRILDPGSDRCESEVDGIGYGESFQEARRAAIAHAVLNGRGAVSGEERYAMGALKSGSSECKAEGFLFVAELLQCVRSGDRHRVKVRCSFEDREGELSKAKEKVEAVGWGQSEEEARQDAERNAIDSVFGRKVTATVSEENGKVTLSQNSEQGFAQGYVEDTRVDEVQVKDGLHMVKIQTVVRQVGVKVRSGFGWIGWTVAVLVSVALYKVHPAFGAVFFIIAMILGC